MDVLVTSLRELPFVGARITIQPRRRCRLTGSLCMGNAICLTVSATVCLQGGT